MLNGYQKTFFLWILAFAASLTVFGQDSLPKTYVRNGVWATPVKKNTIVNGVAFGYIQAVPWMNADSLKINGLNLDVSLFCIWAGIYAVVGTLFSPFSRNSPSKNIEEDPLGSRFVFVQKDTLFATKIKGVSIGAGGLASGTKISGLALNGVTSFADIVNGVEITGIMNLHYSFSGIQLAGLRNKVTTGKGLQIGFINTCKGGRVVQIGLINRIGKRIIPFVNFSLKKAVKSAD